MPDRTPGAAFDRYLEPLQRAISCVTPVILTKSRIHQHQDQVVAVASGRGEPVRLRGPGLIHLRVRMRVRLFQAEPPRRLWEAQTVAYEYRPSNQDGREIVGYHRHPEGQTHVRTPHLHLGPGAEIGRVALMRAYLPTGAVPVQGVLRLAIETFEAEPVCRDLDRVLQMAGTPVA